eukprot:COSAG01_NODE_3915_length_5542_cov_30.938453_3_plen_105_part_00
MPAGWQEEHDRRAQLPAPPAGPPAGSSARTTVEWGVDGHHRQHHPADGGKVRTRVEEAIWTQIRHCHSWAPVADPASEIQSSENRKMRCSNYKPFLVVAEKGPL